MIVIGGSAGVIEALSAILGALPADFPIPVLLVVQLNPNGASALPSVLSGFGALPAEWAENGAAIRPGHIIVAPPDHHLTVDPDGRHVCLTHGPLENRTRPAIDPLFRSSARACGGRVIGVLLSGTLSDGTAGLADIARRGGTTVVEDSADARFGGMPSSALAHVGVDHVAAAPRIGALLASLVTPPGSPRAADPLDRTPDSRKPRETAMTGGYELQRPVALTCPICGGAVADTAENGMAYFACHIGHRFGATDMEAAQLQQLETALEIVLRTLNERATLCERMAHAAQERGAKHSAKHWRDAAEEALERAGPVRGILERTWLKPSDDAPR